MSFVHDKDDENTSNFPNLNFIGLITTNFASDLDNNQRNNKSLAHRPIVKHSTRRPT